MAAGETKLTVTQISGLIAVALGVLVVANDFTALSVALPSIEKTFDADVTTAQWVITGYALMFGVSIVTGGRLADMFGRRKIFFIGAAIFAGFSLIGGLATDVWTLLIARGLMGIGGAMIWPAMIGIAYTLVPEDKAALVGGLVIGVAGFGNALGPLLGGVFTEYLSWRWVFYINVPAAIISGLVLYWVYPSDTPNEADEKLDYPGVAVLSAGLFGLLLMMDIGADLGWLSPTILALFLCSLIAIGLFFKIEQKSGTNALVPKDVMENKGFLSASVATLMMSPFFLEPCYICRNS